MSRNLCVEDFDLPVDGDPGILAAVEYWRSISPGNRLPGRQHFDPTEIPNLLSGVWLIDVEQQPLSFVFRLVGTDIVDFF
ncbi:MAG: PAS domain-containing protein, partial [Pseudomonadota bacterium]